jgi:hypothetical protein
LSAPRATFIRFAEVLMEAGIPGGVIADMSFGVGLYQTMTDIPTTAKRMEDATAHGAWQQQGPEGYGSLHQLVHLSFDTTKLVTYSPDLSVIRYAIEIHN